MMAHANLLAPGRLRQKDCFEFGAIQGYIMTSCIIKKGFNPKPNSYMKQNKAKQKNKSNKKIRMTFLEVCEGFLAQL